MKKWFALTGLGDIVYLGEFEHFEDADTHASEVYESVVWVADEETAREWLAVLQGELK